MSTVVRTSLSLGFFGAMILSASRVDAAACPFIQIVLDRSGSMGDTPDNMVPDATHPSKWQIGTSAIQTFLTNYGDRLPIGFMTFQSGGASCTDFTMEALVPPAHNTAAAILQKLGTLMPAGGTNTGEAIDQAVKLIGGSQMSMPGHPPGGYIILITDGEPNCNPGDGTAPTFTVSQITMASMMNIPTFAVGFGLLSGQDATNLDLMAAAGGKPCMGTACNGHKYYVGDSATTLNMAIDAISQQIQGEFGGACDDSCYANGCMGAGEICVNGMCKIDPCINIASTCAPGDYCYTDGSSQGMCAHACATPCGAGQVCNLQGMCVNDACATVSCGAGQTCHNGSCVTDSCDQSVNPMAKPCNPGLLCYQGTCMDDPCRYVTCPSGFTCLSGTGACAAGSNGGSGPGRDRGASTGCTFSGTDASPAFVLILFAVALAARARRRRAR
jgi:Mg-chelatase subunit ChlD